ncbi:NAD-dependent epimerase/dehydratase family protein [Flavobacterium nackdongense]|uniref:SDR family oxidoreductase n=1 Tax=Flavobacterium nackdongense TaxID=2547394 RepID=A0A4P6Y9V1_9FLAO|nr:SDR family oxidoreductase [Flavobacterium nackdongense]QBN19796.1 SDR family oxidoreductase [Flavobacterium nackdongense]
MNSQKTFTSIIIGSNGYIGRNLSFLLYQRGIKNIDYDVQASTDYPWMNYSKLNVTSKDDFCRIGSDVDVIYFMAGLTGTVDGFASYESYYNVNVIGLTNLLNYLKENNLKAKIVFPSTRLVYKGLENKALEEDAVKSPNTIYALTKLICEDTLDLYHRMFNIKYSVFRICVPYGNLIDLDYSYGTIGFFIEKAKNRKNITLYGDGSLKRTFTDVYDICDILIKAANNPEIVNSIYNIGGETFSLLDVAKKIADKYEVGIDFVDWPEMALKVESGDTIFSSKKLNECISNYEYKSLSEWSNLLMP